LSRLQNGAVAHEIRHRGRNPFQKLVDKSRDGRSLLDMRKMTARIQHDEARNPSGANHSV
jgi:hypothetical protein